MRPSGRTYLCSWEIPYDFTPRIHHYPGVERSVVREAWERPSRSGDEADAQQPHRRRIQWKAPKSKRPPGRPRPLSDPQHWQPVYAPVITDHGPQTSRTPKARGKVSRARPPSAAPPPPAGGAQECGRYDFSPRRPENRAAVTSVTATTEERHDAAGEAAPPASTQAVLVSPQRPLHSAMAPQTPQKPLSPQQQRPPPRRFQRPATSSDDGGAASGRRGHRYTAEDIARLLQRASTASAPLHEPSPPPAPAPAAQLEGRRSDASARHRYGPRTRLAYTLPPQYGQWRRWLQSHKTVPVQYRDSYHSRHAPPALHTVLLPRQHSQRLTTHTQAVLQDAMEKEPITAATALTVDDLLSATAAASELRQAHTVRGLNDFNANVLDVYAETQAARLAALDAREERVYDRIVGGVIPIEAVLADASDAPARGEPVSSAGSVCRAVSCVAVLDNGHLSDPIVVTDGVNPYDHNHFSSPGKPPATVAIEEGGVAVLVQPIEEEVSAVASTIPDALARAPRRPAGPRPPPLPRGREWDRQRAIQHAVGTTAQEALIDLQIDPRYRRPGEYVRWRHDGGQRRAVK